MKKITILSGKGGVGKSSITASLAAALSKKHRIVAADCDVDASNLALVLGIGELKEKKRLSTNQTAEFDLDKCTGCRKCFQECYFHAIGWKNNKPRLKQFGCEGCGVCELVCPANAVKLVNIGNAELGHAKTKYGFPVVSAQLGIGQSGSGKVVTEVRKMAEEKGKEINAELMLIDAAAGIGCPVIASVAGVDYVLAVTEPTPSGFADLKRALKMVDHFNIPYGLIINRHDINPEKTKEIKEFAGSNNIEIIYEIPYDKCFVDALVRLMPIIGHEKKYERLFFGIRDKLINNIKLH
ncbi:P-loop NTPase [Candidatus Woesearchaeota archaeon]|nr:P-loop NTPase [Candidatus Woesearchaeota archaeon]